MRRHKFYATCILVSLLLAGCKDEFQTSTDLSVDTSASDSSYDMVPGKDSPTKKLKGFGESCTDSAECNSAICIKSCNGSTCSKKCTPGSTSACPVGHGCIGVTGAIEPGKVEYVCVKRCDAGVKDFKSKPPDAKVPDAPKPPDAKVPDAPIPDIKLVLKKLVDMSFADFSKGTFRDSGAKSYVSAKGAIQGIERFDLNNDGYMDLLIPNLAISTNTSYIYWGSKQGFSASARQTLKTNWAEAAAVADIDDDGYMDLVIGGRKVGTGNQSSAVLEFFWGSSSGYSSAQKTTFPIGSSVHGLAVADLNRDGYIDVVVPRRYNGSSFKLNSYVYWGSKTKVSHSKRLELPTLGGNGAAVADLNMDGHLDLIFANTSDGKTHAVNSYIYWGSSAGFTKTKRADLPTVGAKDAAVADLNKDGHLDLVFANFVKTGPGGIKYEQNSYIYWGSSSGYSPTSRTELPTIGGSDCAIADLNADGHLDVVFSNQRATSAKPTVFNINSYVYWGSKAGYSASKRLELPVLGAESGFLADVDLDGYIDITFANVGVTGNMNSFIYHGGKAGYSTSNRTELPGQHAEVANAHNSPGAVYDRSNNQIFTSRILDTNVASPSYQSISWKASTPVGTSLAFQLRSAKTMAGVKAASWVGPAAASSKYVTPSAINKVHKGERYIQYRVVLTSDHRSTPVLDQVTIEYY